MLGAFPAVPDSQLSQRVEAFPRGLEAPGCSSLCPLGRPSPTSDFPSGHCWNTQLSLCVFSLWVGAWELETLFTSFPHPAFGGPDSLGLKPERGLWSGEGSQLTAQNSFGEGKLCCRLVPGGPLHMSPSIFPVHDQYNPNQYGPDQFHFKIFLWSIYSGPGLS